MIGLNIFVINFGRIWLKQKVQILNSGFTKVEELKKIGFDHQNRYWPMTTSTVKCFWLTINNKLGYKLSIYYEFSGGTITHGQIEHAMFCYKNDHSDWFNDEI